MWIQAWPCKKPAGEHSRSSIYRKGKGLSCRECDTERRQAYRKEHPEREQAYYKQRYAEKKARAGR